MTADTSPMNWPTDLCFAKTAKGIVEIRDRLEGIPTRARQVLILVNGRRSIAELSQLIPEPQLSTHLRVLEAQAFITRVAEGSGPDTSLGPQTVGGPVTLVRELWSDTRMARVDVLADASPTGGSGSPQPAGGEPASVPMPASDAMSNAAPEAAGNNRFDPVVAFRNRLIRHLLDTVGPAGDVMAERIGRCGSLQELRDLMPAVSSIVEAIRGPAAAREFVVRATKSS